MTTPSDQLRAAVGGDWVAELADRVLADRGHSDGRIVTASGISPSGPIHLGNLREIMVPHLVAEEVRSRGLACEHVLSWDVRDDPVVFGPEGLLQFLAPARLETAWAGWLGRC